jgi:hypothetical protein
MRSVFVKGCWVPMALWIATLIYIAPYDGWGAWAAAPLLVPSVLLSIFWGAVGAGWLAYDALRKRPLDVPVLWATLTGGVVIGYYVVRHLLR